MLLLRPRRWWLRCHHPTSHCSPPSSSSSSSSSSSPYLHPTSHCSPISSSSTNSLSPPQLALFADHHSTPRTLRRPITDLGVHLGIFHRKKSEILICRPYGFRGGPPAHVYYLRVLRWRRGYVAVRLTHVSHLFVVANDCRRNLSALAYLFSFFAILIDVLVVFVVVHIVPIVVVVVVAGVIVVVSHVERHVSRQFESSAERFRRGICVMRPDMGTCTDLR